MSTQPPTDQLQTQTPTDALDQQKKQQELLEATNKMFSVLSEYLKGELQGKNFPHIIISATSEDFRLLENMNLAATEKYKEVSITSKNLTTFMQDLHAKYAEFDPYLKKIEQIDNNVNELERTVSLLDDYTKRLEDKFKRLAAQKKEIRKGK